MKRPFYYTAVWVVSSVLLPDAGWAQPLGYNLSLLAGSGTAGYLGDNGPATSSELANPCGIVVDSAGNVYIADQFNNRIRKISTPIPGGNITTVAGTGTEGYTGDGAAATSAEINLPWGIMVDQAGDIIFSQTDANGTTASAIREVSGGNIQYPGRRRRGRQFFGPRLLWQCRTRAQRSRG